jgi:hypothetical protein
MALALAKIFGVLTFVSLCVTIWGVTHIDPCFDAQFTPWSCWHLDTGMWLLSWSALVFLSIFTVLVMVFKPAAAVAAETPSAVDYIQHRLCLVLTMGTMFGILWANKHIDECFKSFEPWSCWHLDMKNWILSWALWLGYGGCFCFTFFVLLFREKSKEE